MGETLQFSEACRGLVVAFLKVVRDPCLSVHVAHIFAYLAYTPRVCHTVYRTLVLVVAAQAGLRGPGRLQDCTTCMKNSEQQRWSREVVKRRVLQQSIREIWMPSPGPPRPCGLFLDHSDYPFLAQDLHARRLSVQLHSAPDAKNGLWHPEPGHWTGSGPGIAVAC